MNWIKTFLKHPEYELYGNHNQKHRHVRFSISPFLSTVSNIERNKDKNSGCSSCYLVETVKLFMIVWTIMAPHTRNRVKKSIPSKTSEDRLCVRWRCADTFLRGIDESMMSKASWYWPFEHCLLLWQSKIAIGSPKTSTSDGMDLFNSAHPMLTILPQSTKAPTMCWLFNCSWRWGPMESSGENGDNDDTWNMLYESWWIAYIALFVSRYHK